MDKDVAESFLRDLTHRDLQKDFGVFDSAHVESVVAQWMDDEQDAAWRFAELADFQPGLNRILDMACGCGTAVFWGLKHGLETYGIDPNADKHRFLTLKAHAYGYPEAWLQHFRMGVGEQLPYADGEFDAVLSYQTLEHVQDLRKVLAEIIRVIRVGGCANLRFPDYRGTFEGHYLLPWIPLFPKGLAKAYLRLLGRPMRGLEGINYVTASSVIKLIESLRGERPSLRLEIEDGSRVRFLKELALRGLPVWQWLYVPYWALTYFRCLFHREMGANLFIRILAK